MGNSFQQISDHASIVQAIVQLVWILAHYAWVVLLVVSWRLRTHALVHVHQRHLQMWLCVVLVFNFVKLAHQKLTVLHASQQIWSCSITNAFRIVLMVVSKFTKPELHLQAACTASRVVNIASLWAVARCVTALSSSMEAVVLKSALSNTSGHKMVFVCPAKLDASSAKMHSLVTLVSRGKFWARANVSRNVPKNIIQFML